VWVLSVGEHALDVPVQRQHDADPRKHQEVAALGGTDQAGVVLQRDELATARQRDRVIERS
jgi:hypothetical protein